MVKMYLPIPRASRKCSGIAFGVKGKGKWIGFTKTCLLPLPFINDTMWFVCGNVMPVTLSTTVAIS